MLFKTTFCPESLEFQLQCFFHVSTINLKLISVTARSPLEKTRYETSLGLLTKKFVSLFHSSSSGTVDLNKVIHIIIVSLFFLFFQTTYNLYKDSFSP